MLPGHSAALESRGDNFTGGPLVEATKMVVIECLHVCPLTHSSAEVMESIYHYAVISIYAVFPQEGCRAGKMTINPPNIIVIP